MLCDVDPTLRMHTWQVLWEKVGSGFRVRREHRVYDSSVVSLLAAVVCCFLIIPKYAYEAYGSESCAKSRNDLR